jgi:type III secretion protein N (ATPase)
MKAGRIIDGDEHDARTQAQQLIADATAQAGQVRNAALAEAVKIGDEAAAQAAELVSNARAEAQRTLAQAQADAVKLVDAARAASSDVPTGGHTDDPPGRVEEIVGWVVRAVVPGVALGEVVHIDRRGKGPLAAEVVGFRGDQALALPLGELAGVAPASAVWRTGAALAIRCGDDLLGRALDGLGQPIDGGPSPVGEQWPVERLAPPALERPPIKAALPTGVRAIDALLTLGCGQRVGLFAAAGVGKSTLLGQIARGCAADVTVVCQVGERGRELAELLGNELAPARHKTVVVCATSDAPPLVRVRAAHVATSIAEWFRDRRGANVLLLVDSLTRVARAQREVGLSAGEPPARHGYPPSVFALLPRLIERAGATTAGAITAIYTVLVAGNDMDEPIADEVRGLLDGHITLERRLAQRGHFPPIDVVSSVSRLMAHVIEAPHAEAAAMVRTQLAVYEEHRDLISLGAYQPGRDRALDDAVAAYPAIERLLRQPRDEAEPWASALAALAALARRTSTS